MRFPTREEIAGRLENYPLLLVLLFDYRFRIVFFLFLAGVTAGGLLLPKMWRTSPADFTPVIRVSGLDMLQAWSLQRTAKNAETAGEWETAMTSWKTAVANNAADEKLVRSLLECAMKAPSDKGVASLALLQATWLLKLSNTNLADLERAAQVFDHFDAHDYLQSMLEPVKKDFTPALHGYYLKTLFHNEQMGAFQAHWTEFEKTLPTDIGLRLYRTAYLSGWGSADESAAAKDQLRAALENPDLMLLANKLNLLVATKLQDAESYRQSLTRLEDRRKDTLTHHLNFWKLLMQLSREKEALELLHASAKTPESHLETLELARIYSQLGLKERSIEILKLHVPEFGYSARAWAVYAAVLIENKLWDDLRSAALQILSNNGISDRFGAFGHFMEGRAEIGQGRSALAEPAFAKIPAAPLENPNLALYIGTELLKLGHPKPARDLLQRFEANFKNDSQYWMLVFSSADALRDVDLMLSASGKAFILNPKDAIVLNNYAASLLITRNKPEEVIKLTLMFMSQHPESYAAKMNHGLALMLNRRVNEAEEVMKTVNLGEVATAHQSLYHFILSEIYLSQNKFEAARESLKLVKPEHLYPPQHKILEEHRKKVLDMAAKA